MAIKSFIDTGAIWDGDTYSVKYFGVSKNFTELKLGKNTITLSPSVAIVPGTKLEVEVLDRNGNRVQVEYPNQITPNGSNILHITITEETLSGVCRFFIRGTAFYDADTGQQLDTSYPNVIWRGISSIKKLEDEETPEDPEDLVFEKDKKDISVNVQSKCLPYQDKGGVERPTEHTGTGTLTYNSVTTSSTFSPNIADKPTTKSSTSSRPISQVNNSQSNTTLGSPTSNSDGFPTLVSSAAEFTADMVGSTITITPNINSFVPTQLLSVIGVLPDFTATIIEVLNSTTVRIDNSFSYSNPQLSLFVQDFTSSSYTIKYNKSVSTTGGQKVTCYAQLCFDNVATSNGQVDKVRVSAKPVGAVGDAMLLGDFDVQYPNKMQDTGSFTMDPRTGIEYKSAGDVSSSADVSNYYTAETYQTVATATDSLSDFNYQSLGSAPTPTHSDDKLMHSLSTSAPVDGTQVTAISVKDQYLGSAKAGNVYKIILNAHSRKDATGKTPKAQLYISGPAVEEFTQTSNTFGTLIETITGGDGETQTGLEYKFTAASDSDKVKLYIVLDIGTWDFSNIKLEPSSKTNNTPNEFCTLVPLDSLPVNKINEEYVFVVDFIGKNGKPANIKLTTQSITLNSDVTIDESLVINTFNSSTLIQTAISGSSIFYMSEGGDETDVKTEDTFSFVEGGAIDMSLNVGGKSLTICHEDTSTQSSIVSNGSLYIKSICLDTYGHVTCIETEATSSIGDTEGGSPTDDYVSGASFNTSNGELTLNRILGGSVTVDLDGRYATSDSDTVTTVGTSSLGSSGTITLLGSGSIELFEQATDSGSIITIYSDSNPLNVSGSLISGSFDGATATIELFRQSTSSVFVPISSLDTNNYVCGVSFNTTNGCLTLNRLGLSDLSACLDGRYSTSQASNCTITLQGDGTGINTVIGDFTLDQTSNETLTVSHKDTSTLLGSYGTNGISSITVDSLGHITAISTATYCTTDTNNYVCNASFNTSNGELTLNRLGLGDVVVNFDGRYCTTDTDTNNYVCNASFNTSNGELTLNRILGGSVTVDLDGRYCTTDTDTNNYVCNASFNTSNGELTLNRILGGSVTVDLDGRYCTTVPTVNDPTISVTGLDGVCVYGDNSFTLNQSTPGCVTICSVDSLCSVTVRGSTTAQTVAFQNCAYIFCSTALNSNILPPSSLGVGLVGPFYACNLTAEQSPTHILAINNPTGTYQGGSAEVVYTSLDQLNAQISGSIQTSLGTDPGTLDTTTTNIISDGVHCHAITTTQTDTASTIVQTNACGEITAANFITTSDKRLKKDIEPIKSGLDVLQKFNSYTYLKKGICDAGFIAQEVCSVLPYSVQEDSEGFLTIKENHILAHMHKAILELNNKLNCLETKLG
jgi:hypothetical protein